MKKRWDAGTKGSGMSEETPIRVQRSRKKGSRLPPNTVCVSRGTKWGNPYKLDGYKLKGFDLKEHDEAKRALAVRDFEGGLHMGRLKFTEEDVKRELRGKNLACWCPLDKQCHADVLLAMANEGEDE